MTRSKTILIAAMLLGCGVLLFAQNEFKQYTTTIEHDDAPLPPDWNKPSEWVFGRLKYPDVQRFNLYWTMDYPQGDRHLAEGIRRLTRVDARSVEQVVDLDDATDVFNWPFLYAVEVGMWDLTVDEAAQLRTYLLRGGFLMVDDFHGVEEWDNFASVMGLVFPDRDIIDLQQRDIIFHTVSDVDKLEQIPSLGSVEAGVTYEKGGITPHWRGILDDKGRVMVAICHNMDLGDAVEQSNLPRYPEHYASLAYRVLTNFVVYNLTH